MATYTTNYNLEKPDTTEKYDIAVFNSNFDIIDEQIADAKAGSNLRVFKCKNDVTSNDNALNVQAGDGRYAKLDQNVPIGGIIMFSGTILELPAEWKLCDGNNGTPNLLNKFIRGTDQAGLGSTGGSDDAVVVSHSHTGGAHTHDASHNHTASSNTTGSHTHQNYIGGIGQIASNENVIMGSTATDQNLTGNYTASSGSHSHTITVNTASFSTGSGGGVATSTEGVSGTGKNIPAYYALAYIQRVA